MLTAILSIFQRHYRLSAAICCLDFYRDFDANFIDFNGADAAAFTAEEFLLRFPSCHTITTATWLHRRGLKIDCR